MQKVILIDDHNLFRLGISAIINQNQEFSLFAEYDETENPLKNLQKDNADLYLIDINLGEEDGLYLSYQIKKKKPGVKVIILSMYKEEYYLTKALEYNLDGYIHKNAQPDELINALKKVMNGEKYFSQEVSNILINNIYLKNQPQSDSPFASGREKEIIKYVVDGFSSKQISEILSLSPRTIDNHRANILKKFGLKNSAELVQLAVRQKII